MRRGHRNGWMEDDNKQMIACNLGSDYVSEHEWGIKGLYETLGIKNDESVMGIERYRVNPKMDHIRLIEENKNNAALVCFKYADDYNYMKDKTLDKMLSGELSIYNKEDELATAWDGSSFGIRVKRPVNIKRIKRLYDVIAKGDAAVWLGGGHVFQNAGLVVGIISAIPDESKQKMYNAHMDRKKLEDASDATGIKQKIDALNSEFVKNSGYFGSLWDAPCAYYALSPAWIWDDKKSKSKYPVHYWLNPMEQKKNAANWYTVEELEQWMEGKGPVKDNSKEAKAKSTAIVPDE